MIIFDSSSLILLAKISLLNEFVLEYDGSILIPEKVRDEVCLKGYEETPIIEKLITEKKIIVSNVRVMDIKKKLMEDFALGEGEADVLLLAINKKVKIIATDDRNAMRACKMFGLKFVTAIAFIIRAYEKGLINRDEALIKIEKLNKIGRYSKDIINHAKRQIKKEVKNGSKNS